MIDYLYDKPPPLVPISNVSTTNKESTSPDSSTNIEVTPSSSTDCEEFSSASLVEHVRSVIDENIQQNKFGKKRITRSRNTNKSKLLRHKRLLENNRFFLCRFTKEICKSQTTVTYVF